MMNTLEVLKHIADIHKDISHFTLVTFPQQRLVQNWLKPWGEKEMSVFENALRMKAEFGIPFWNGIMLSSFNNEHYSSALLKSALHHNPNTDLVLIERTKITKDLVSDGAMRWAINSKVLMTDSTEKHIPMIDFHIAASNKNLPLVLDVCDVLDLRKGFLLESGASYHYIGLDLVSEDDLMNILIDALLFCPIVDGAWISHQMKEKSCSLRIDKKNGLETKVVKFIGEGWEFSDNFFEILDTK